MDDSQSIRSRIEWVIESDIPTIQQALEEGTLTSEELVLFYLDRIAREGQQTNAILEINPHALQIAQALDLERKTAGKRSMLHGIPILLKDNMDTGDAMHTSAGSLALENHYASQDAFLVKQLRKAGVIILGKTNMTEWANFMSDDMPNGWSSRGGQVLNPYGQFEVGGSSSGSAVAISTNLAVASIGTETTGSIIHPAAQNGIVGLKPTVGAISRSGIIPLSVTQDTAGPMTRTVTDAALVFEALIGKDLDDPITIHSEKYESINWLDLLDKEALKGVRIGIPSSIFRNEVTEERMQLFKDSLTSLEKTGARIIPDIDLGTKESELGYDVLLHECKASLNHYLGKTAETNPIRSIEDVIKFNNDHPDLTLRYGQELLKNINDRSGTLTELAYIEALLRNRHLAKKVALGEALEQNGVDILAFPQDHGCSFEAAAGYPAITVPAGVTKAGEPFGLTFTGPAFSEPSLLGYAYAFEQQVQARREPRAAQKK
ncbi:amidase family protein [Sporosarcina gallistercoris]|uniref:Amidase n=1 Tax=Sporosarcina gallistercoris TaxID=2762245 RepID=A0ABR8PKC9_9BACL|nr:amidase family protein [Sporosarcina gallistercoris]MBD7908616.1 amidase [Sporosarcina gallistercoris]